jgi:hypothetical protein
MCAGREGIERTWYEIDRIFAAVFDAAFMQPILAHYTLQGGKMYQRVKHLLQEDGGKMADDLQFRAFYRIARAAKTR